MKEECTAPTRRAGSMRIKAFACLLGLAVALACAPKAGRRHTDIMEKTGAVSVSAATLRARVNDLADWLGGRLEQVADRIGAETQDGSVRRRALVVKVDAIRSSPRYGLSC